MDITTEQQALEKLAFLKERQKGYTKKSKARPEYKEQQIEYRKKQNKNKKDEENLI